MELRELKSRFANLDVYEQRDSQEDYEELVFYARDLEKWEEILCDFFGQPAKPAEAKPTRADSKLTREFGGVFKGQTLFKKDMPEKTVIAMLWPWQDNEHITLKIASIKK
ncbi:MAG: hypothetical protein GF375_07265 [Candidatus Omnitrophica bacterium]|nr:hypothetical protein [Candidatus Omnitrophota bacterium]MBD3269775.1 hypothetical protein [Candidatus Omnitrophota bacterium]